MLTICLVFGMLLAFPAGYYFGSLDKKDPFFDSLEAWSTGDLSVTSLMSPNDWFLCATQIDRSGVKGEQRAWVMREFALGNVVPVRPDILSAYRSCFHALAGFCDEDGTAAAGARAARAGVKALEGRSAFTT